MLNRMFDGMFEGRVLQKEEAEHALAHDDSNVPYTLQTAMCTDTCLDMCPNMRMGMCEQVSGDESTVCAGACV